MAAVHQTFACAVLSVLAVLTPACVPEVASRDARAASSLIRTAEEAGGREDPEALRYLAQAERTLARARVLIEVGDGAGARMLARRARADAEVAELLAIEITLRRSAERSEADAMDLERQIEDRARAAEASRATPPRP